MTAIVVCIVPVALVDTIALTLACQYQSLNLYLAGKRLAVAIVEHIVDMAIIGLEREVVILIGGHHKHSTAYLVGHLGLYQVAAHGVAVERCRGALIAQGMNILRRAGVAQL